MRDIVDTGVFARNMENESSPLEQSDVLDSLKIDGNGFTQVDDRQTQAPEAQRTKRKMKRKNDSLLAAISQWIVNHQIGGC